MSRISRRTMVAGGLTVAAAAVGAGAVSVMRRFGLVPPDARDVFAVGNTLSYAAHRVFGRDARAREFSRQDVSGQPFANAIGAPTPSFAKHQSEGFAHWALDVRGLVKTPQALSLAALRTLDSRTQVTALTCEEGWSYIAEWTGTPLSAVLAACGGVQPSARWVVYAAADGWVDSIDMDEAMHPQTLVAWGMNGAALPVPFGGPLRMRVPRQLGYKSVKFIERLLVTDSEKDLQLYMGPNRYAWYSGI